MTKGEFFEILRPTEIFLPEMIRGNAMNLRNNDGNVRIEIADVFNSIGRGEKSDQNDIRLFTLIFFQ